MRAPRRSMAWIIDSKAIGYITKVGVHVIHCSINGQQYEKSTYQKAPGEARNEYRRFCSDPKGYSGKGGPPPRKPEAETKNVELEDRTLRLEFGFGAFRLAEQLERFVLPDSFISRWQHQADSITTLVTLGLFTESEALPARKRLLSQIADACGLKSVKSRVGTSHA